MSNQESIRVLPTSAAQSLFLGVSRERALLWAPLGADELAKRLEENLSRTVDLLLAVINQRPDLAEGIVAHSGLGEADLRTGLERCEDLEPEHEPDPELGVRKAAISGPLRQSMVTAKNEARAAGATHWTSGQFVAAAIAHPEGRAQEVLRSLGASPERIEAVLAWLRSHPDPEESSADMLDGMMRHTREMIYRMRPAINERIRSVGGNRDRLAEEYEKHPERYAEKPDLLERIRGPVPEGFGTQEWWYRTSGVTKAARWQALSRHAPEVTTEHLLLTLVEDGTDTSWLLDREGVDRDGLRTEMEGSCPAFADGPAYPPDSAPFSYCVPEPPVPPEPYSDLHHLLKLIWHADQPAVRALRARRITEDVVKFGLRERLTGDPAWHLRRPDVKAGLAFVGKHTRETVHARTKILHEAAVVEARLRGSPVVSGDHLVLALLTYETESRRWIEEQGLDPDQIALELDGLLERQPLTTVFPKPSTGFIFLDEDRVPFCDLTLLAKAIEDRVVLPTDPEPKAGKLLAGYGITVERVREAVPAQRPLLEVMEEELEAKKRARRERDVSG